LITINHINIETNELIIRTLIELIKNFFSHLAIPKAIPFIGLRKGAINIAPIITATEFCNKPNDAIIQDKNISIQYNLSGFASFFTLIATSVFSSFSNSKNSILLNQELTLSQKVSFFLFIISSIHIFFTSSIFSSNFVFLISLELSGDLFNSSSIY